MMNNEMKIEKIFKNFLFKEFIWNEVDDLILTSNQVNELKNDLIIEFDSENELSRLRDAVNSAISTLEDA